MTAKTGFLAESSRQPRIDFSKPLQDPIFAREWLAAGAWIGAFAGAVAFGLHLAKVL